MYVFVPFFISDSKCFSIKWTNLIPLMLPLALHKSHTPFVKIIIYKELFATQENLLHAVYMHI